MRIENNISHSNTNFCAKLMIKKWEKPLITPERWQKIADIFEQKTKNHPHDIVEISTNGGPCINLDIRNENIRYTLTRGNRVPYTKESDFFEDLDNRNDNDIVDILAKILEFSQNRSNMFLDFMKFADNMREKYRVFEFGTDPRGYGLCGTKAHSSTDEFIHSLIAAKHEYVPSQLFTTDIFAKLGLMFEHIYYNGTKLF